MLSSLLLLPLIAQAEPSRLDSHPAQAELFLESPDVPALLAAYEAAPMARLFRDDAALGALRRLLGQPELTGEALLRAGLGAVPLLDGFAAKAYERIEDLRTFSCSLAGRGEHGEPGVLAILEWSSTDAAAAVAGELAERGGPADVGKPPAGTERFRATPSVWSLQADDRVVLGSGSFTPEVWAALANGAGDSLADRGAEREIAQGLGKGGAAVLRGFHRRNPADVALEFLPSDVAEKMAPLAVASRWMLGDGPMRWRMSLGDGRFLTETFQPGVSRPIASAEWLGQAPLAESALASAHPGALLVAATTFDGPGMHAALLKAVSAATGQSAESLRAELDAGLPSPSAELCAKLGPSLVLFVQPVQGIGVPGTFLVIDLKSADGVLEGIAALVQALARDVEGLAVKASTYKEVPWLALTLPPGLASLGDAATLKPCLAVLDGRLVVTDGSLDLKKEIRRRQGDEKEQLPPASYPWSRPGSPLPGGATALLYIDWAAQVNGLFAMARAFGPMLSQFAGDLPFDLATLPAPETFTKYMPPTVHTVRVAEGGLLTRHEAAFAFETWIGLAGLAVEVRAALEGGSAPSPAEAARDPRLETVGALRDLRTAVAVYRIDAGRSPAALEDLLRPTQSYPRGFLEGASTLPVDGWGRPFRYQADPDGAAHRLWSTGADGIDQSGGGDDVEDR